MDWHAEDNEYVYFSPGNNDFYLMLQPDGTDGTYGFIFNAETLIREYNALVGPDLMTKYDELLHEVAKEIDARLPRKTVDEAALQAFFEQHAITDPNMQARMRQDEAENYYDVLYGMLDREMDVPGVREGLAAFKKRVKHLKAKYRVSGAAALARLRTDENLRSEHPIGTPLEILVASAVPISIAVGQIRRGKEESDV